MDQTPPRPSAGDYGDNEDVVWAQWVHDVLTGKISLFVDNQFSSVRFDRTANGKYIPRAKISSGTSEPVIPQVYRGEYYPPGDYVRGQWVEIKGGATAGSYVCTRDHPGASNPPWVGGGYWSKFADMGGKQWM